MQTEMDPLIDIDEIPAATLVTAREHLDEVCAELAKADRIAIDIESNGFYAYREKVCLIQISSPTEDFIVDPVAFTDLSALGPLLSDARIEKLFHAGEYDLVCLKRDYGFVFENLFDTMIASRVLGFKELGLAAAIERHFGISLSKKLQRADWGKRPLTEAQLRYAQFDTHFLMALADIQKRLLVDKGRMEDAREAFLELAAVEPATRVFDPEGYWKLAARDKLQGPALACLREIYLFREEQAASRDRAHFRVMADELMVRIAKAMPKSAEELRQVRGMTPYLLQKFQGALLRCVQRGREAEPPKAEPRRDKPKRDIREWKLFEELRQWRKGQAQSEGVEPVVIIASGTLREIARLAFSDGDPLRVLSPLKRQRYGEALAELLKKRVHA